MGFAAALAAVEVLIDEKMVENSAKMGEVMRGHMERMQQKHGRVGARPPEHRALRLRESDH